MKILYISQYFYPEMGSPASRVHELCKYWAAQGHEVTVLTSFPNYPDGVVHREYKNKLKRLIFREQIDGIDVIRVWALPTDLRSYLRRGLNYLSFFFTSLTAALPLRSFDVIIATSPSLFAALSGLIAARLKGIPLVFEVRDLWPEVITAVGAGTVNSVSYRIFDKIASTLYKKSDIIVAVTESFKEDIVSTRAIPPEKIVIVENAVDTDLFKPSAADYGITEEIGLKDKFIVSYIGTIGLTHGAQVILSAAEELRDRIPDLVFLLIGDGFEKDRLVKIKEQKTLDNVLFLSRQPRSKIPKWINASDISLVLSIKNPLLEKTIFAKVFEPMSCGKPIIVGALGETKRIVVDKANAGIAFEPENARGLVESIIKLYDNRELGKSLGENGRKFVLSNFSRSKKAQYYLGILETVAGKKKTRDIDST